MKTNLGEIVTNWSKELERVLEENKYQFDITKINQYLNYEIPSKNHRGKTIING